MPSWCSSQIHMDFTITNYLLPLTRNTYQSWAFGCPSAAVEDPCLSLSYCAGWFCTGPRSCCCCWMCCCSPHQRAFLWILKAKQDHKTMQTTVKAQLGEWFNIQEFSVTSKSAITGYYPGTKYVEQIKHTQNSAVSAGVREILRPTQITEDWKTSVRLLGPPQSHAHLRQTPCVPHLLSVGLTPPVAASHPSFSSVCSSADQRESKNKRKEWRHYGRV